jgi:hypothetical protein
MPRKLRSVAPGEAPPKPRRRKTMTEAAESNDDLALYEALRKRLVEAINDARTPAHAMAPLARQVAQTSEAIDRLIRRREADTEAGEAVARRDEPWDESVI